MLQLVDLLHVLVLDSEVLKLTLDIPDPILHLVGLLYVNHKFIKLLLQRHNLLIYPRSHLILLSLIEYKLLDLVIEPLYPLEHALRVLLYVAHLLEYPLYLLLLSLQIRDNLVDTLQILVTVKILRGFLEFTLHIGEGLLFMLDF
jgi:hypothetical protein